MPSASSLLRFLIPIGTALSSTGWVLGQSPDFGAWIFDSQALARELPPFERGASLDSVPARAQLWGSAWRLGPLAAQKWVRSSAGSERVRLTLLAALGLGGGPTARAQIEKRLGRRPETEVVFACFAAARAGVAFPSDALMRVADDGQREEVERLAARFGLLALGAPADPARWAQGVREKGHGALLYPLYAALFPERPPPAPLPVLASGPLEPGSLEALARRARLLLAAARPGFDAKEDLLAVLTAAPSERVRAIASLALGRLATPDDLEELLAVTELDRPRFYCGLTSAPAALQETWLSGPSPARSEDWRALWWAATTRLLSPEHLDRFLPKLLEHPQESSGGLEALCGRLLTDADLTLRIGGAERDRLLAPTSRAEDRFRVVIGLCTSREPLPQEVAGAFSPKARFAFDLFREGRLGHGDTPAGTVLMQHLRSDAWLRPAGGPGSFRHAFLLELNQLVRDVFVAGSDHARRQGRPGYLPRGIRPGRDDYFEILDQLLEDYPLFRT